MGQQSMQQYPVLDMIATGARIKALREAQGISPAELSERMGLACPQTVYRWQRGETLPGPDNLILLSCILNVPIDEILVTR